MAVKGTMVVRLQLYFIVITAVTTIAMGGAIYWVMDNWLTADLQEKAILSACNLQNVIRQGTFDASEKNFQALTSQAEHADRDFRYALISSAKNNAAAHRSGENFSRLPDLRPSEVQALEVNGVLIRHPQYSDRFEVVMPVAGNSGSLGLTYLRYGYSNSRGITFIWLIVCIAVGTAILAFAWRSRVYASVSEEMFVGPMRVIAELVTVIASGELTSKTVTEKNPHLERIRHGWMMYEELGSVLSSMDSMTDYLKQMAHFADAIARGDLSIQVTPRSGMDIFGVAFQQMLHSLHSIIRQLADGSANLQRVSAKLAVASNEQSQQISNQAHQILQSLSILDRMKNTVNEASEKAGSVLALSEQTIEVSNAGKASLQTSTATILKLNEQVDVIALNIVNLSEKISQISEITEAVHNIADQCKLLAVNAAIEAVKSGEAGKGFRVVATAVKDLASQSKMATDQVQSLIREIQQATLSTTTVTKEGSTLAQDGVREIEKIRINFNRLSDVITESASVAKQIATVTYQQASGIEQVVGSMSSISKLADSSAVAAEEQNAATQSLSTLASNIAVIVAHYKLHDH
jgi:methyl-accepting chemotaxis protein